MGLQPFEVGSTGSRTPPVDLSGVPVLPVCDGGGRPLPLGQSCQITAPGAAGRERA